MKVYTSATIRQEGVLLARNKKFLSPPPGNVLKNKKVHCRIIWRFTRVNSVCIGEPAVHT